MQCPKCKTENPDDAKICRACGCALENAGGAKPPSKPKTSWLAGLSLVLAVATLSFFYLAAIPSIVLAIVSLFLISKSRAKLKGKPLAIAAIIISVFLMSAIYLWCLDAPPIPNDYTIDDLRSAPPDCAQSYYLLLTLADSNESIEQLNETAIRQRREFISSLHSLDPNLIDESLKPLLEDVNEPHDAIPAIGLTVSDDILLARLYDIRESDDYAEITKVLKANADGIIHAWQSTEKARDIVRQLNAFPEIADLTQPEMDNPPCPTSHLKTLTYLYHAYVLLQCEQGNSRHAVNELIELDSVCRKLSVNARSLVAKLVCFAGLKMNLRTANSLVNSPQISKQSLDLLAAHFKPLSDEQIAIRNVCICHHLFLKNMLDTQFIPAFGRSTPMPKRNSTLRLFRNYCDTVIYYTGESNEVKFRPYSVWPSIYLGFMPEVSLAAEHMPWQYWWYRYYNPAGCLFLTLMTPNLPGVMQLKTSLAVQDDLFQIVLNKRLGKQVSLKARAYSDEYIIDVEAKKIFSPGPDGEPNTPDDIKLPINPQVLGF